MVREDSSFKATPLGGGGVRLTIRRTPASAAAAAAALSPGSSSSSPYVNEYGDDDEDPSLSSDDGGEAIVVDPMTFCQPEMSPVVSGETAEADPLAGTQQQNSNSRQNRKRKSDQGDHLWEHPVELKKLLVGDLSQEMTVSVSKGGATKQLPRVDCDPGGFGSLERHRFVQMNFEVKPIRQHGDSDFYDNISIDTYPEDILTDDVDEEEFAAETKNHGNRVSGKDAARLAGRSKPTSPGRLESKDVDVFTDPETGLTRYKCRNNCGTSLASAKGRRKHEKRHCPLGNEDHPLK